MQRRHLRRRCCSVPGVRSRVRVEGRACQACAQGFYKSGDACYPCGLTCKSCRSGLDCDVCTDFYARNDDGICMPGTGCQVAKDCGPGHFCGQTKTCAKCMGSGRSARTTIRATYAIRDWTRPRIARSAGRVGQQQWKIPPVPRQLRNVRSNSKTLHSLPLLL
uniref:Cysteine-rich protein n=1 Tax=Spironucleus salmonicida TaxID=348837 RepID=V6LYG8_9EUKA|eukprot:EST45859.1 hypothetical protein SS50377_14201 [Spironucleus salmonicida]